MTPEQAYIKQLEKQNEELKNKLAKSELRQYSDVLLCKVAKAVLPYCDSWRRADGLNGRKLNLSDSQFYVEKVNDQEFDALQKIIQELIKERHDRDRVAGDGSDQVEF